MAWNTSFQNASNGSPWWNQPRYGLGDVLNSFMPWGTSAREQAVSNTTANRANLLQEGLVQQGTGVPSPLWSPPGTLRQQGINKQDMNPNNTIPMAAPVDPSRAIHYAPGQNTGVGLHPTVLNPYRRPTTTLYR